MPAQILGALVVGESGAKPLRLCVGAHDTPRHQPPTNTSIRPLGRRSIVLHAGYGDQLHQCTDLVDEDARNAVAWAQMYAAVVLGWPSNRKFEWKLTRADGQIHQVPPISGTSIFGLFCLAFLRAIALDAADSVNASASDIFDVIVHARTDFIAISAAFNPRSGRFARVGKIEEKLAALSGLGAQTCRVCFVEQGQPILLERVGQPREYELYRLPNGQVSVAVVRTLDPLDAVRKLFVLQGVSGLRC